MENLSKKFFNLSMICESAERVGAIKSRKRQIVYLKSYFSVYMYKNTDLSLHDIGRCLGLKHCTVQRNVRIHKERLQYPDYMQGYDVVKDSLDIRGFDNPKNYRYKCV